MGLSVRDSLGNRNTYSIKDLNKNGIHITDEVLNSLIMEHYDNDIKLQVNAVDIKLDFVEAELMYIALRHYLKNQNLLVVLEEEY